MNALTGSPVPPLTAIKKDGTPYQRRADVTAAIAHALTLPSAQWASLITGPGPNLPSEALVHLLRRVLATDKALFGTLVYDLQLRIEQAAKRWARGIDRTTTEELLESVQQKVTELVLSATPSNQQDFLEVAFAKAIKNHTLKAVEKRRNRPLPLTPAQHAALGAEDPEAERPTEQVEDESPHVEELVQALQDKSRRGPLLKLAQAAVRDVRHYEVLFLFYGFDWQISAKDPQTETLSTYYGVSARQIGNWMRDGIEAIRLGLEKKS